ncbi:DMT family transporter [Ornithinimicrobium avium]|uniref:QacE family quaternary ammonium compound efflux SMR transporter n=1 Tax=Ornithinimicrobium avium TaxID=2283195 RepID=A0A345NN42_9MICO|nr:multidrug efflux SMR transporter [Ornithinimicrobium avium]AXH96450.1 QacE family quaternary ammonium compound efflux SMR transporter [Ornithinimicrobium avium]
MAWAVLLVSAVFEAVWATALGASDGLSRPVPTVVFVVFSVVSLVGLGRVMRTIPTGTAYAVWTGTGAVLTVAWAALTGAEPLTLVKGLLLAGIIGCVVGLKLATPPSRPTRSRRRRPRRSSGAGSPGSMGCRVTPVVRATAVSRRHLATTHPHAGDHGPSRPRAVLEPPPRGRPRHTRV